jgi:hypothetical protein
VITEAEAHASVVVRLASEVAAVALLQALPYGSQPNWTDCKVVLDTLDALEEAERGRT